LWLRGVYAISPHSVRQSQPALATGRTLLVPPFLRSQATAYVLLPLAALCWSGNHIVARFASGHVPPASLAVVRWLVVAMVVGIFGWRQFRDDWPTVKKNVGVLTFLAIMGGSIFGTLQFVALQYTTALNMGVVGSVAPAFIVAASWLLFGDRLSLLQLFGVGISLLGVLAIVSQLSLERLASLSFNGGDLMIIANMVFWGIYCACLKLRPAIHPLSFLLAIAVVSGITNLPFAAWEHAVDFRLQLTDLTVGAIAYAAFITTLLAYVSWNRGIDLVGAPRASAFLHTIPLFSAVLATSLLGEQLMLYHVIGFALILGGVTLAARPSRRQPVDAVLRDGRA
jgi:drug/metabolite transporter (DMT)-like permease